jgi:catechol 2,3-dioxygenase-like lactoylglutathione lyase family enzyme
MNQVQVEQKSYQMPPQEGFTVAHFLTVADIERSARFYETVFGGRILSRGDSSGAPGYIQIANTWLIVNVGGGPTPDKPSVTLSVSADPDSFSSFMSIRVARGLSRHSGPVWHTPAKCSALGRFRLGGDACLHDRNSIVADAFCNAHRSAKILGAEASIHAT